MAVEEFVPGYTILNKVCEGSSGAIYRATRLKDSVDVALKVLKPELALDKERLSSFRHEAKMLLDLNHPNIVRVYSLIDGGAVPVIEMEYFESENIKSLLARGGQIPYLMSLKSARQLAAALAHLHEREIIHRGVTLENALISEFYETRLIGFSSAILLKELKKGKSFTEKRKDVGLRQRIAPEEVRGGPPGLFTDVYCFGVVLYALLTERLPFPAGRRAPALGWRAKLIAPPRKYCKDMSEEMEKTIMKMLEKRPCDRFPDMQTAGSILASVIEREIFRELY
jgi:serine/threonine-protein kinase